MIRTALRGMLGLCLGLGLVATMAIAQESDDSLLEKALQPANKDKAPVLEDGKTPATPLETAPVEQPPAPQPGIVAKPAPAVPAQPNVAPNAVPNLGQPAVGGAVGGGVAVQGGAVGGAVAAPAARSVFMPSAGIGAGPFGPRFVQAVNVRCGESLLMRGMGFGVPAGRVVIQVDRLVFDAAIVEWGANGIQIVMPQLTMLGPTDAMIHVIGANGLVVDRMPVDLFPTR